MSYFCFPAHLALEVLFSCYRYFLVLFKSSATSVLAADDVPMAVSSSSLAAQCLDLAIMSLLLEAAAEKALQIIHSLGGCKSVAS